MAIPSPPRMAIRRLEGFSQLYAQRSCRQGFKGSYVQNQDILNNRCSSTVAGDEDGTSGSLRPAVGFWRLHSQRLPLSCRQDFKGSYVQKHYIINNVCRSCSSTVAGDEDSISGSHEETSTKRISTWHELIKDATKSWLKKTFNKESMSSEEHAALHMAKMKDFRGSRDDFDNPIFDLLWAPWAESVQYIDPYEPRARFDRTDGTCGMRRRIAMKQYSYAIPTLSVLRYMVFKAPDGKIAEIGSGMGYWASLLQKLGANVVAVDDFSDMGEVKPMVETVKMDGAEFIKQGGADGRALFLCWPCMKPFSLDGTPNDSFCLGEACLDLYKGNTVFFVGEKGGCTYDVEGWMETHREMGWRLEMEMAIPCWSGIHDSFMCFVKHEES